MIRSSFVFCLLASTLLAAFAACGGGEETSATTSGGALDPGFTACGDFPDGKAKTCQPGQFCAEEGVSQCDEGCLSNVNCAADQTCNKVAGETTGSCQNNAGTTSSTTGGGGDELKRCQDACTKMLQCGLTDASEGAQCTNDCNGLSDVQRKAIADCVEPWSCSDAIPGCLDPIECGPSYPCADSSKSCVGHACL